jgi:hypothetical protein
MSALGEDVEQRELDEWETYLRHAVAPIAARRTKFESPLIPIDDYHKLSILETWNRWPTMLTQIHDAVSAEDLGEQMRQPGLGVSTCFFFTMSSLFGGRKLWELLGEQCSDQEAKQRYAVVFDFWRRTSLAWRGDGFWSAFAAGDTVRPYGADVVAGLAEHALSVNNDEDRRFWQKALSRLMQYSLLLQLEVRFGFFDSGPYPLPHGRTMLIREYAALGQSWIPWSAGIPSPPDNDLIFGLIFRPGLQINVNDIATSTTEPEGWLEMLEAVAPFRRDSNGQLVALDAADMARNEEAAKQATVAFYRELMTWSWERKVAAGAFVHFNVIRPWATAAGVVDELDWSTPSDLTAPFMARLAEVPMMIDRYGGPPGAVRRAEPPSAEEAKP